MMMIRRLATSPINYRPISQRIRFSSSPAERPISPFHIYQIQLTSTLSIFHRITGALLTFGVYGGSMMYAVAPFQSSAAVAAVSAMPGVVVVAGKFALASPYTYHFFNGIRHLFWDAGYFLSLKQVYLTGYATVAASMITSLGLCFI